MTDNPSPKSLGTFSRIASFLAGLCISSFVFVWGFNYRHDSVLGHTISFMGFDMTGWITISIIVLVGVFGGYLIQVGVRGKTGF